MKTWLVCAYSLPLSPLRKQKDKGLKRGDAERNHGRRVVHQRRLRWLGYHGSGCIEFCARAVAICARPVSTGSLHHGDLIGFVGYFTRRIRHRHRWSRGGAVPYSLTIGETLNAGCDDVAGFTVNGNITAPPVPVPASLAMLGSGLLALILVQRQTWGRSAPTVEK